MGAVSQSPGNAGCCKLLFHRVSLVEYIGTNKALTDGKKIKLFFIFTQKRRRETSDYFINVLFCM